MSDNALEMRIIALEDALLEYIGRYGATDLARRAFRDPMDWEQGQTCDNKRGAQSAPMLDRDAGSRR
jgi:hypothetical protein